MTILDVGGTQRFRKNVRLPHGSTVVVVNTDEGVMPDWHKVSDIPHSEETFDLALMFGLLAHLSNSELQELLIDVRKTLKPGARLLISEPDATYLAVKASHSIATKLGDFGASGATLYTGSNVRLALVNAGFSSVRQEHWFTPQEFAKIGTPYFTISAAK